MIIKIQNQCEIQKLLKCKKKKKYTITIFVLRQNKFCTPLQRSICLITVKTNCLGGDFKILVQQNFHPLSFRTMEIFASNVFVSFIGRIIVATPFDSPQLYCSFNRGHRASEQQSDATAFEMALTM